MEKLPRSDYDDPNSLTTFNIIAEGDGEGLISKIFHKFKTAVSGPQQLSPASSTRTISIVLSNESGVVMSPEEDLVGSTSDTMDTSSASAIITTETPPPVERPASIKRGETSTSSVATITPKNLKDSNTTLSAVKLNKHIVIDEDQNQQQQQKIDYPNLLIPIKRAPSIDSDTQSIVTTFSVSNTNSLSRILNRLRGAESIDSNKDFWMPDEQCRECFDCNAPFNIFRRKHHCRTCGKICVTV